MIARDKVRIGILTFHRASNVGANLQAYALCAFLNKFYPQAELIDFYPNSYRKKTSWKRKILHLGKLILVPQARSSARVSHKFEKFQRLYPKLSTVKYFGDGEIKKCCTKYDILISGSDQILNLSLSANTFAYYLPFDGVRKISYASSFGRSNISDLEKWAILNYFPSFDALSFREESGYQLANSLIGLPEENVVADPTFLLSKKDWESLMGDIKKPKRDYILVYSMEKTPWFEKTIDEVAEQHPECRVIILDGCGSRLTLKCRHRSHAKASPKEFLSLVSNAKIIVTNSFHGIAFSMLFEKSFYACAHSKRNTRLEHILGLAGSAQSLIGASSTSRSPIEGRDCITKLQPYIEKSKEYLLGAIDKFL